MTAPLAIDHTSHHTRPTPTYLTLTLSHIQQGVGYVLLDLAAERWWCGPHRPPVDWLACHNGCGVLEVAPIVHFPTLLDAAAAAGEHADPTAPGGQLQVFAVAVTQPAVLAYLRSTQSVEVAW